MLQKYPLGFDRSASLEDLALQAFKVETMPARTAEAALPGGLRTLQSCQEQVPQLKGRREKEGMMGFGSPRTQALQRADLVL